MPTTFCVRWNEPDRLLTHFEHAPLNSNCANLNEICNDLGWKSCGINMYQRICVWLLPLPTFLQSTKTKHAPQIDHPLCQQIMLDKPFKEFLQLGSIIQDYQGSDLMQRSQILNKFQTFLTRCEREKFDTLTDEL
jgi:hypothetical protein